MQGSRTPPMQGGDPAWTRLVLVLVTRRCVRVCASGGAGGGRGAEIRRQNALHRASIAHHHRAATPTTAAAATAATALRGPEMAHLERRSLRVHGFTFLLSYF